jgi:hypothetical protein
MSFIFCSRVSKNTQINEKMLFAGSRQKRLLLSFVFVFGGPAEHYGLENLGGHLAHSHRECPYFSKKENRCTFLPM